MLAGAGYGTGPWFAQNLERNGANPMGFLTARFVISAALLIIIRLARMGVANMPNTADAHRLLLHAVELGSEQQVEALLERLFIAYFHQGRDLGDGRTLLGIAESCGLKAAQ